MKATNRMKTLFIKNYKNIRELKINSLSRVNLIIGQNNTGKSTLLEAISIHASDGDFNWLKQILNMRGELVYSKLNDRETNRELNSFLSFFYNYELDFSERMKIIIATPSSPDKNDNAISIRIVRFKDDTIHHENETIRKRTIIEDDEMLDTEPQIGIGITGTRHKTLYPLGYRSSSFIPTNTSLPFEYIQTGAISRDKNATLWDKIALTYKENYIIEALQIIEPRIDRINFIDENSSGNSGERIPVVTFKGEDKRYHLSSMGDGINRILTIILALVSCEGGIFLLDEFENGLHYSVQKQLWKIIFSLAERLNIQAFVTTHSNDCIAGFAEINTGNRGKLIRLEFRNETIVATGYDNDSDIRFAIEQDIEIR